MLLIRQNTMNHLQDYSGPTRSRMYTNGAQLVVCTLVYRYAGLVVIVSGFGKVLLICDLGITLSVLGDQIS
ncbi:uncharacterized protein BO97DRAFT_212103 [Aspergillus homomorphus CBS 101889]|uniref:Uncharacterized protein n=1 Tax=Aspergillus homomorphus (strain CBS 101889) TaxID=1450537 RepID=A0A395IB94_ASPHC|nr:hypothetical protein BO97DRAFT_212103 [Aspergillus homomorphus CBS 101889]RAL15434.1 hypothetical protein BO97DRAFT_212103 [Aspergillus homomorphus CBS 101889]